MTQLFQANHDELIIGTSSTTVVFLDERHKLPLGEFFESVTSGEYGRGKSAAALI